VVEGDCSPLLLKKYRVRVTPIQIMKEFYAGSSVAFRVKGESEWIHTFKPTWNWGVCDYKIIDLELDDYFW